MASNPGSNQATDKTDNNDDGLSSTFQTTVCLRDWWLIKAENDSHEKRLAIAGFTSKEQRAVRVFSSAPIAKRFDTFTLETVDGVCIIIKGFINQQRTTENGFPREVFSHFVFGFPSYWEQYAAKCLEQDSDSESESPNKCEHTIHEDRKEAEVSKDLSHKVSANIGIGVSKVSNADGKIDQVNITTTSVRRSNRMITNELNDGCVKDGLQQTSSVKRGHKFRNRSIILKNSIPTSTHFLESESPNKCEHTIHEDRKEAEVSEDLSHKVSANIGIGVSKVSNADGKIDQVNITTTSVRRSNRLSNNELNDGCVKDGLQQTSSVKRGRKFRNRKTQGGVQNVRKSRSDGSVVGFDKKNQTKDSNIAVGEGETYSKERSSSRKKPMRKLNFDTHVTPCKQEALAKVSVVSPETSSFKRSRSGRVLLPTLEFWRNQMPIYDADHKLIGIQEAERPRGS